MKTTKSILALFLAVVICLSGSACVFAGAVDIDREDVYPAIVIPGVFQSEVKYLDDEGNEMLDANGNPYEAPFFLQNTNEIIKDALINALIPIGGLVLTQTDKENMAANAIADVLGKELAGNIVSDANGHFIKNIVATKYDTNLANLSAWDRSFAMSSIPLYDFAAIAGYENMYFFSYASLGNIIEIANELYDLIQIAKSEHNGKKVNLAPVSQGGSLFNALMQIYKDKGENIADDVNRVCMIIPAADGTAILGDIYRYGLIDDPAVLYDYMLPNLIGENKWFSYAINLALRFLPNADVDNILKTAVHKLVEDYLENSTCLWALLPSGDYPACREMYLMDDDNAVIREQADWYYQAQCDSRANILAAKEAGVEFFDIVDYNFPLHPICKSWDKINADGVIHIDSTSFGCTSVAVDKALPDDYQQANTYCTDPSHNHIDEARLVDASTGILCETTFYFKGQQHEQTARNDVIIRLATRILADNGFENVFSDPAWPQFNYARHSSSLSNLYYNAYYLDLSEATDEQIAEYNAAMAAAREAIDSTCMKTEDFYAVRDRLQAIVDEINGVDHTPTTKQSLLDILTTILRWISNFIQKVFQGKGWSEMFPLNKG